MSSPDISGWRIPVGQKEAEASRLEVKHLEQLGVQAAHTESLRLSGTEKGRFRTVTYVAIAAVVVVVVILALMIL